MDFDLSEIRWLTEILRSHQEAIEQLRTLPPEEQRPLGVELARRQMVLGSEGFAELVNLVAAHRSDMARYRKEKEALHRDDLAALEASMSSRLELIRERIASVKYLLDSI